ncbi:lipopolysaccharide assembly protein LapB [Gilvimarinus sp. DA14]|uniref:lipopolysaccharide assembly protein LapB n=1 Tax=Gilvimarinus sp. DA14 TaxID=2956798 RepID=UPI0020B837B8|nr:lipopolysaccharide assembly protein LapB [Gilvimarinus sp. DA14]UTF60750.1 lipopolysaccharide assembly protein LapB [Gilvimarinus sp. DA14]
MDAVVFFAALLIAVAVGYGLGRYRYTRRDSSRPKDYALQYYKGLSYLFNEQPDSAIDAFISSLDVNSDTLETHLALGNMLRKRGEVSKAIKIHQNLLARPGLTIKQQHESQLELARDYIRSGLLDRAEALLLELVKLSSAYKQAALVHLIEIYQDENEWDNAISMASKVEEKSYQSGGGQSLPQLQAHFSCEQALVDLEQRNYSKARTHLLAALGYDFASARASLLFARLEISQGRYRDALDHLHKIPDQDPDYIPESLQMTCESYEKLGESASLLRYLKGLLQSHPSNSLVIKIADRLRWDGDDYIAADFIAEQFKQRPSIRTLNRLIELYLPHSAGRARENLQLLKQLVDTVIAEKPSYCCSKCGFTGNSLHWLCPGCKTWGSIKPIRGVAGE